MSQFLSADRVLFAEIERRTRDGQPDEDIEHAVQASAHRVFDLLKPALDRSAVR